MKMQQLKCWLLILYMTLPVCDAVDIADASLECMWLEDYNPTCSNTKVKAKTTELQPAVVRL